MELLLFCYAFIALGACGMTLREYCAKSDGHPIHVILGLVGCLLWPITFGVAALLVVWQNSDNTVD